MAKAVAAKSHGEFAIYPKGRGHAGAPDLRMAVSETERLQMLNEVSRALTSRLELHDVYDTVYERISRIMDTTMFFLAFRLPQPDQAYIAYLREFGRLSLDVTTPPGRSVTTHVFGLGQPLLFHSAEQYERYAMSHGLPVIILGDESEGGSQSMIFAPLNTGTETIGTLSVQSTREHAFSQHDFDTLTVIAAQAAIAVQNARLFEASRNSARRHQAMVKVAETINSSLTLSSVLNAVLDGIREVLPYHLAAIMLPNEETGGLDAVGSVGELTEEQRRLLKVPMGQGVTGRVLLTGEPLILDDVTKFEGYIAGSSETKSEAAVPLKRGDTVVGVLNVERNEFSAFGQEEVEFLLLFATQAAIAIENARLFEDQQNRVRQMQAIQVMVREMTTVHQNEEMARAIERGLKEVIHFDDCIIYLVNETSPSGKPSLEPIVIPDLDHERVYPSPRAVKSKGESVSGWIWENAEACIIESARDDPRVQWNDQAEGDWTLMGVPLMHQNRVSGIITLGKSKPHRYTEADLNVLEIVAAHAAIGFDRCRLYEELHLQATTDELTSLYNRRHAARRLDEEMSRASRNGQSLGVILMDCDEFKAINDTYGHDAGDEVLQGLAHLLLSQVRTEDIVSRYGGEEFLILLPEVDIDGAAVVAERIRRLVAETILAPKTANGKITVSVGVAILEAGDSADQLVSRADRAMYESKKKAGNQVCAVSGGKYRRLTPGSQGISEPVAA